MTPEYTLVIPISPEGIFLAGYAVGVLCVFAFRRISTGQWW